MAASVYAQPLTTSEDGIFLSAAMLEMGQTVDLSTVPWRFHEGDNPAWADPVYNDSAWALINTDFPSDSLGGAWQGIGWFRLHLRVDSSLHNTLLGFYTYHAGASEIYLDGEKIGGFGEIGTSAETDQIYIPKGLPLTAHLDDSDAHVLAVRYTNRALSPRQRAFHALSRYEPTGFALVVGANTEMVHRYTFSKSQIYTDALLMGMLLLIAALHLLLYAFDRRDHTNLFFGLSMLCMSIGHFGAGHVFGYQFLLVDGALNETLLFDIGFHGFMFFLLLLLATVYSLYAPRLVRYVWIAGLVWLIVWGMLWNSLDRTTDVAQILILLLFLETIRVTAYAIYKRQEGGWMLGASVLITALAFLAFALGGTSATAYRGALTDTPRLVTQTGFWLIFLFVPLPLGMSVLLARRYTSRSQRLELELERVEELSAQTLAQEREKQALIASQNERLEAEVEARTAELRQSQQQLVHAEKMASLGALTAGIAHEIKNPLNFINNFAEVNEELADELQEALTNGESVEDIIADLKQNATVIAQHGKRADGIVKSMMAHAREGKGEREAVNLNALIDEHVELAYHGKRAQTPGFNVKIERDFDEGVGNVEVVPQDFGRVILNLVGNAFDAVMERAASENGTYEPVVHVVSCKQAGGVEIRVADNGPGMNAEVKTKVFEPFFTTKPTGTGTGLGLSLSYDIITQGHGGTLTVESKEGNGAAFVITLPHAVAPAR